MSEVNFDELVRSNIQEVLAAVALEQPGTVAPASAAGCQQVPEPGQLHQQDASRRQSREGDGSSSNGMLDSKLLEVPQNSEATIRLLKARLKSVEKQLGVAMSLNQEKDAEIADLQMQLKQTSQKDAAYSNSLKALEAQVERHRHAAEVANEALAAKEQRMKELSKEGAQADKDRRLVEQESRARDVRLQRALEEVTKYKELLQDVKKQGQEVKDVARGDHVKALHEVKRLERQKGELMVVLRKQAKLIDVLRRQRAHLEAARLLAITEEEFLRTLDAGA